ncbi:MAG TPA: hypothetical protein VM639_01590 [Dongiaceae bacterium]|nr:hypothetical protein [Dongiaceae bacterium]
MSKIVRIAEGHIVEIFETMPVLHASLMAQIREDAPDAAAQGWSFDGMNYAPPPPLPPPTERDYLAAVQAMLDAKAQERAYDGIVSACTYAGSGVARFDAEGTALKAWRDLVWNACYARLAQILAGPVPQLSPEDFAATMPSFAWPS